ncbi:hypothetical protein C8R44DRAFT_973836 [Mycena epipterygia]|nr:hypothetical protein C8R44DRAFT_973836 [Mycena epipterygia]
MPALRRFDSDTTHVSDSEPEREASQPQAPESHACTLRVPSKRRRTHIPFSDRSNAQVDHGTATAEPYFRLESRMIHVEREIANLNVQLHAALKALSHITHMTLPTPQHEHSTADKCVGGDTPMGALDSPLVVLDDAVQEEVARQLSGLHKGLDEFEKLVERDEARHHLESMRGSG